MKNLPFTPKDEKDRKRVLFFYVVECGDIYVRKRGDDLSFAVENAGGIGIFADDGVSVMKNIVVDKLELIRLLKNADVILYNSAGGGKVESLAELITLRDIEYIKSFKACTAGEFWITDNNFYPIIDVIDEITNDINAILYDENVGDNLRYFHRLK